jgi:hypothetical protein
MPKKGKNVNRGAFKNPLFLELPLP